ncbi:MAG: hypothetical protein ACREPK_01750 [Rhodanobacteraceae bacterium]
MSANSVIPRAMGSLGKTRYQVLTKPHGFRVPVPMKLARAPE